MITKKAEQKNGRDRRNLQICAVSLLAFLLAIFPVIALAAFSNPLGSDSTLWGFLVKVLQAAAKIAGVVAALAIMWAGFLYVTAQGDEGKIKTAHSAFRWAIVGTLLMLGATVFAGAICEAIKDTSGSSSFSCPTF